MGVISLPWSMEQDRLQQVKANSVHVDENFDALLAAVNKKLEKDGSIAPTADLPMASHKITQLATPTATADAATKGYVDSEILTEDTAIKGYVDTAIAGLSTYHPELFAHEWDDHLRDDMQWLRADTFSWQDGTVYEQAYQHLVDDIADKTLTSETVAGTTIYFYLADDGHKICPAAQETNVSTIYSATGSAWYYIIDTDNDRFKLPRVNPDLLKAGAKSADVVTNGETLKMTAGGQVDKKFVITTWNLSGYKALAHLDGGTIPAEYASAEIKFASESGLYVDLTTVTGYFAGAKYLYFYVGSFTQEAIENTAGLNAELFNGKVDVGHQVIAFQAPTADNNYTWYRLYVDGWVEQGGFVNYSTSPLTINLPIAMADTNYTALGTESNSSGGCWAQITNKTTATVSIGRFYANGTAGSGGAGKDLNWIVSGMAANS